MIKISGKKQPHAKMPKTYGKVLKRMSKSKEDKENEEPFVNEELAVSIFK